MRIISPFKDYYDSALAYGIDPNLVYRREATATLTPAGWDNYLSAFLPVAPSGYDDPYAWFSIHLALVVIGSKGFRVWVPRDPELTTESLGVNSAVKLALPLAEARTKIVTELRDLGFGYKWEPEDPVDDFLTEMNEPVTISEQWSVDLGAPCFVTWLGQRRGGQHSAILNPRLATLGVERYLDPYSAFQEITMFLGQKFAAEDKAPRTVGDDRVIAQSKGFDDQSFRTAAPGNKKENRKANRLRKKKS